jgi:hypothetical protein
MSEIATIASTAWRIIEDGKPSASLASQHCTAVPEGDTDPVTHLTGAQGPNRITWRLKKENLYGIDVVDIAFDLRWEYGARYRGGGAYIPNCYLYVPQCDVLWGFDVNIQIHVHNPSNAGTETAPIARLPLTISGAVSSPVNTNSVQWDFVLYGNGQYQIG